MEGLGKKRGVCMLATSRGRFDAEDAETQDPATRRRSLDDGRSSFAGFSFGLRSPPVRGPYPASSISSDSVISLLYSIAKPRAELCGAMSDVQGSNADKLSASGKGRMKVTTHAVAVVEPKP